MGLNTRITRWLDEEVYRAFPDRWDDALFNRFILDRLEPSHVVLDIGAGAGIVPEMDFRDHAARVCGLDPDPRVVDNPHLSEGKVGFGEEIPYDDETFDLVFCDNVLEHLERPAEVFREVRRVLKPGGRFLGKTPNYWHYVAIGASLTPHSFHRRFNAGRGRDEEDTFPTCYRANTRRDLRRLAAECDLELRSCEMIEGRPEYLRRWWPTYLAGAAYEKLVNSTRLLEPFRVVLVAEMSRRPS